MQRLDVDDLIGRLIAAGGWTLLELPAEVPDGTLLAPNVLRREKLDDLKHSLGSAVYSTQYGQNPKDDSGAIVQRVWWRFHRTRDIAPNHPRPDGCDVKVPAVPTPEEFNRIVIAVDMTFGEHDRVRRLRLDRGMGRGRGRAVPASPLEKARDAARAARRDQGVRRRVPRREDTDRGRCGRPRGRRSSSRPTGSNIRAGETDRVQGEAFVGRVSRHRGRARVSSARRSNAR